MKKLIKYDKKTIYMYPNGVVATPERVVTDYPACEYFTFVIETTSKAEVIYGFYNLSSLRNKYDIDNSLTEEEAIVKIEEIINTPQEEVVNDPTPEERIAAALEYQNLMSMEDTEEVV